MSCQTIDYNGQALHISYGPETREIVRRSEGEKWCFHCRTRREFFYIVTAPVVMDWYGPNPGVKCGHCNTSDGDLFPGREREWDC